MVSRTTRFTQTRPSQKFGFPAADAKATKAEIEKKVLAAAKVLDIEHLSPASRASSRAASSSAWRLEGAGSRSAVFLMDDRCLTSTQAQGADALGTEALPPGPHATVIYVTHDQFGSGHMADKMAVMNGGCCNNTTRPRMSSTSPSMGL